MFVQRVSFQPAPGKGPELREYVVSMPRQGRGTVSTRLAGPSPEYRVTTLHDSLAALEQALNDAWANRPKGATPLAGLAAKAPAIELLEVLLPAPEGPNPGAVAQTAFEFAPGKGPEVRRLLEEIAKKRNAEGARMGIAMRVSGGPPAYFLTGFHADLAAVEKARAAALADPEAPARAQRLAGLLARPPELPQIFRIIARFG
ncbi:MAG TPA: hypothetical protein VKV26_17995 [Dehalococcoidia bacterium]|nr:hypothetical protein [Dehalococcoidia bacterium]